MFVTKAPSARANIEHLNDRKSRNLRLGADFARVLSSADVAEEDPVLSLRLADLNAGSALPWAGESAAELMELAWGLYNFYKHLLKHPECSDRPFRESLREAVKHVTSAMFATLDGAFPPAHKPTTADDDHYRSASVSRAARVTIAAARDPTVR